MVNVIFVHGTSTREPFYSQSLDRIATKFAERRDAIQVLRCYWRETQPGNLGGFGKSIPGFQIGSGDLVLGGAPEVEAEPAALSEAEQLALLWGLLYDDPLAELALLAESTAPRPDERFAGQSSDGIVLYEQLARLAVQPLPEALTTLLAAGGIDATFAQAIATVSIDPRLVRALDALPDGMIETYQAAVARAIVAQALRDAAAHGQPPALAADAPLRDATVAQLVAALEQTPGVLGIDELYAKVANLPAWAITPLARQLRSNLTTGAVTFGGDILRYQKAGAVIRDYIYQHIMEAAPPVVLLAHSLGGVACVDLLLERDLRERVKLLVTVGSQAPLFYEMGALQQLEAPQTAKLGQLPPWLNIYDRNDFLAFVGEPLFGDQVVQDHVVSTGQPVTGAHTGYWATEAVYDRIVQRLADLKL